MQAIETLFIVYYTYKTKKPKFNNLGCDLLNNLNHVLSAKPQNQIREVRNKLH